MFELVEKLVGEKTRKSEEKPIYQNKTVEDEFFNTFQSKILYIILLKREKMNLCYYEINYH